MDPPGRFLKQDPATKLWLDIGDKKSLDKTRQALREGAPELLKELTGEDPKVGVWLGFYFVKSASFLKKTSLLFMKSFVSDGYIIFYS